VFLHDTDGGGNTAELWQSNDRFWGEMSEWFGLNWWLLCGVIGSFAAVGVVTG